MWVVDTEEEVVEEEEGEDDHDHEIVTGEETSEAVSEDQEQDCECLSLLTQTISGEYKKYFLFDEKCGVWYVSDRRETQDRHFVMEPFVTLAQHPPASSSLRENIKIYF